MNEGGKLKNLAPLVPMRKRKEKKNKMERKTDM
jgi:hypothetical protein